MISGAERRTVGKACVCESVVWIQRDCAAVHVLRCIESFRPTLVKELPASQIVFVSANALCRNLQDRKSTRLNSSHGYISYAVFCLKKKKKKKKKKNTS